MARISYNIAGAAKAASVPEHVITTAAKAGDLLVRTVGGRAVILHTDIQLWLEAQPLLTE